ncbi:uncharacterized protein BJ171DRAFT_625966 [Polychytrium aggregatum]|uniref:uncharacterized protein n=1 Tax=Polychytrium aggregatum TaxID=110093 RepID=UPI0022FDEC6B|nr:uncharacterized protein BJ171DRAFT_625966 [Polychytrium aggregatum]KAI9202878.1 hypothetical protein BJ171DRAFT_625966 [Polychytrium aggregatum]
MGCGVSKHTVEPTIPTIEETSAPAGRVPSARTIQVTPLHEHNASNPEPQKHDEPVSAEAASEHVAANVSRASSSSTRPAGSLPQPLKETGAMTAAQSESTTSLGASIEEKVPPCAEKPDGDRALFSAKGHLNKPLIPSIPKDSTSHLKPISFEIPLDGLISHGNKPEPVETTAEPPAKEEEVKVEKTLSVSTKLALPKLGLTEKDLQEKLANTEARWKVGVELDRLLNPSDLENEHAKRKSAKHRPAKPAKWTKKEEDPTALKRRLLNKEAQAAHNRQREIEKLQAKLALQDQHARMVQERKRKMGRASNEDLNLSWGGENGLADVLTTQQSLVKELQRLDDADSGKGSSSASLSYGQSRSGSGRSTNTNVEITDTVSPLTTQLQPTAIAL